MVTKLKDIPRSEDLKKKHPDWAICSEEDYEGTEKECPICGFTYDLVGEPVEYFNDLPVCSECIYDAVMAKYDMLW